jgi:hypothetical protein
MEIRNIGRNVASLFLTFRHKGLLDKNLCEKIAEKNIRKI